MSSGSTASGSVTTAQGTGSVTLTKNRLETVAAITIYGTYGTVTFVIEGSIDGTNFFALPAQDMTLGTAGITGTISPADNVIYAWRVPCENCVAVRARVTACASGTVSFYLISNSFAALPLASVSVTGTTALGALTTSGAVVVTSNAAAAFAVGPNGSTNPGLQVIGNVGSQATGLLITPAASGSGCALSASGGTNENLSLAGKGTGYAQLVKTGFTIGASTVAVGTNTGTAGALPAGTASLYPTTAADDTVGVVIHANDKITGRTLFIGNGVSNKILKVYPASGGTINGAGADVAFSSASGKGVIITCLSSGSNTWLAW